METRTPQQIKKDRQYCRKYYQEHKAQVLARDHEYYKLNREKLLAQKKEYALRNPEKIKRKSRKYYQEHKQECNAKGKAWVENNKQHVKEYNLEYNKRNSERRNKYFKWYNHNRRDKEKKRLQDKLYYQLHKDNPEFIAKEKESWAKYSKANRRILNKKARERYSKDPEKARANAMRLYYANLEHYRALARARYHKAAGRFKQNA